jgi:transcription elongation factor S-II
MVNCGPKASTCDVPADTQDPNDLAAELEQAIFDYFQGNTANYKTHARLLVATLRDPKNPEFRGALVDGAIVVEDVPTMKSEDMASAEKREELEQIRCARMRR